jgi:hypothetical protein
VLVSGNSGLADMLKKIDKGQANKCEEVEIVDTSPFSPENAAPEHFEEDIKYWGTAIATALRDYDIRLVRAENLRAKVGAFVENQRQYETFVNQGFMELGLPPHFD